MNIKTLKTVLTVAKRLDEKNLVNTYEGNVSAKKDGLIYITPTLKNKSFLTKRMIAIIDEEGNQVGGACKPSSELLMHLGAYRIRPDIGGVVHCHPTFLTAHAICNIPVETRAYPEMLGNFGRFEVAPYGRPGTEKIFENAIAIFKHNDLCLLGNHGVLSVGKDAEDAMNKVEAAEAITKTLFIAKILGKEKELDADEITFFLAGKTNC